MTLPPGTQVGRYVVLRKLGAGGMGAVYEARDERLGSSVAIKLASRPLMTDDAARRRFTREARAAAALKSPHVVAVHDVGEHDGLPYLVMELLGGGTLGARMKVAGTLPWLDVVRHGAGIAAGLVAIHEAGLVHRDLKPENVLLDEEGRCKIADLGLVGIGEGAALAASIALTRSGEVLGTLEYMAPEQADGKQAGPPADVYALGATLFALLAGRPPHQGHGLEVMKKVLLDPAPSLAKLAPETPPVLVDLVERMLAKDPAARPTAATVAARLGAIEEANEGPRRGIRSGYRAAVLAGAAVLAAGVVWTLGTSSKGTDPGPIDGAAVVATPVGFPAPAPRAPAPPPRPSPKLSLAWSSTLDEAPEPGSELRGHSGAVMAVAVSGDHLATGSQDKTVLWWTIQGRAVAKEPWPHWAPVRSVAISADGRKLASADNAGHVWISSTEDLIPWTRQFGTKPVDALAFGSDGATLYGGSEDGLIRQLRSKTEDASELPRPVPSAAVRSLAVSPDGRELLVGRRDVEVWSLSPSVEPLHQVGRDHGDQGVRAVAWIPGKPLRVLAGGDGGWLEVSEAQGGGTRPLPPHKGDVTSVAVSSDGRLGATASRDGKVRLWDLASLEILDEQDLGPGDHANAVALTERGDLLIAGTQRGLVIAYHATAPTEASPGEKR